MRKILYALVACGVLAGAVALSNQAADAPKDKSQELQIQSEARNPWTHLRMNNDPSNFQFVIVSDRTGGHRERVFSKAVEQINLLQPEFVLSVGDLIEGYTNDKEKLASEWREFQNFTSKLDMPFFYVPGNHDVSNVFMEKAWEEKFGRRYYHFVYKDVLFLVLNTDDPPGSSKLSDAQVEYFKKALAENAGVRWTIVALHKPIWREDVSKNGFGAIEKLLAGRNYTVFAGHVHRYQQFVRQGMNYYQLATTGGGSRMRGVKYGEFDHLVWVTMRKNGPVLGNIMLDGILPSNLQLPETVEPVIQYDRKQTHSVKGYLYFEGVPVVGATVSFHMKTPNSKSLRMTSDAVTEGDGFFQLTSYTPYDGAPAGEFVVTVAHDGRFSTDDSKKPVKGLIPDKYSKADTSDLTAVVKSGANEFTFELKAGAPPKVEEKAKTPEKKPEEKGKKPE